MKHTLYFLILISFAFSCEDSEPLTSEDVPSIKYGTSFGMCVGHCITDLEVSESFLYFSTYGWTDDVKSITKTKDFTVEEYTQILAKIDQDKFFALDPVIGCPDCADGGAEWIELHIGDRIKKVTFDYGADVDGLSLALFELRELVADLKD